MKPVYLLFAACLCAFALAAPSPVEFFENDLTVPELLETPDAASSPATSALKSKFNELQMQIKAGVAVTPEVIATIKKMIALVDTEIEPAILEANTADQELITSSVGSLVSLNKTAAFGLSALSSQADELRQNIASYNDLAGQLQNVSAAYSGSILTLAETSTSMHTTCCLSDNAAVPDVVTIQPYVECDYRQSDDTSCVQAADADLESRIKTRFAQGYAKYLSYQARCLNSTSVVASLSTAVQSNFAACNAQVIAVSTEDKIIASNVPQLKTTFTSALSAYTTQYDMLLEKHLQTEENVKTRAKDRPNEWNAVQQIKCLLVNYQSGGSFDNEAVATCQSNTTNPALVIKYPVVPARLTSNIGAFEALADTSNNVDICSTPPPVNPTPACQLKTPGPYPVCTL